MKLFATYLRPTAAFFLSDLHSKTNVTRIAMNASKIEPRFARYRSPLSGMPVNSHPPYPFPPRVGDCENRLQTGSVECALPVSLQKSSKAPYRVAGMVVEWLRTAWVPLGRRSRATTKLKVEVEESDV